MATNPPNGGNNGAAPNPAPIPATNPTNPPTAAAPNAANPIPANQNPAPTASQGAPPVVPNTNSSREVASCSSSEAAAPSTTRSGREIRRPRPRPTTGGKQPRKQPSKYPRKTPRRPPGPPEPWTSVGMAQRRTDVKLGPKHTATFRKWTNMHNTPAVEALVKAGPPGPGGTDANLTYQRDVRQLAPVDDRKVTKRNLKHYGGLGFQRATLKALQAMCDTRHLDNTGSREELITRLVKYELYALTHGCYWHGLDQTGPFHPYDLDVECPDRDPSDDESDYEAPSPGVPGSNAGSLPSSSNNSQSGNTLPGASSQPPAQGQTQAGVPSQGQSSSSDMFSSGVCMQLEAQIQFNPTLEYLFGATNMTFKQHQYQTPIGGNCLYESCARLLFGDEKRWPEVKTAAKYTWDNVHQKKQSSISRQRKSLYQNMNMKDVESRLTTPNAWGTDEIVQLIADHYDREIILHRPTWPKDMVVTAIDQWTGKPTPTAHPLWDAKMFGEVLVGERPAKQMHLANYQNLGHFTALEPVTKVPLYNVFYDAVPFSGRRDWMLDANGASNLRYALPFQQPSMQATLKRDPPASNPILGVFTAAVYGRHGSRDITANQSGPQWQ